MGENSFYFTNYIKFDFKVEFLRRLSLVNIGLYDGTRGHILLVVPLATFADNIYVDVVTGHLWVTGHPDAQLLMNHATWPHTALAPSQVLRLTLSEDSKVTDIAEVYYNDGRQISAASVAVHYRRYMLVAFFGVAAAFFALTGVATFFTFAAAGFFAFTAVFGLFDFAGVLGFFAAILCDFTFFATFFVCFTFLATFFTRLLAPFGFFANTFFSAALSHRHKVPDALRLLQSTVFLTPAYSAIFRYWLTTHSSSPMLKFFTIYFRIACRDEPKHSLRLPTAAAIISVLFGWDTGFFHFFGLEDAAFFGVATGADMTTTVVTTTMTTPTTKL
ncbi:hypothetical protein LSAT2_005019 [Lamellibrachia satsuma]|nr:hypothetical protein LSAT2_005019 [Lamellibrachia satsuma]